MLVVYEELRRRAAARLRRERPGHVLQPTALVHEAYLRLVGQRQTDWQNRAHFFAVASEMMRRILVDHARRRKMAKRSGGWARVTLDEATRPVRPARRRHPRLGRGALRARVVRSAKEPGCGAAILRRSVARRDGSCARHLARDRRAGVAGCSRLAVPSHQSHGGWRRHLNAGGRSPRSSTPHSRWLPSGVTPFSVKPVALILRLRSEVESLMTAHHEARRFGDTPVSMPVPALEPGYVTRTVSD